MSNFSSTPLNPWLRLFILTGFVFLGAFVGQLLIQLTHEPPINLSQQLADSPQLYRGFLLHSQAIMASCIFIGAPWLYWRLIEQKPFTYFFQWHRPYPYPILLTLGLVFSFMLVNTLFIQWNLSIKLPAFLRAFEQWAQNKEAELRRLTELLTTFFSVSELLRGVLVMGVIPAIGEELLFRGIVQNLFHSIMQHAHLAIYASALLFSAIHLQFYGLVPRFLLGVLFGYVYWWTKDLTFPIVAHLFNNAFTLVILFFYQQGLVKLDIQTPQALPLSVIALFAAISLVLAFALQRHSKQLHNPSIKS